MLSPYPAPQESNYFVYIDSVAELKFEALAKQVSRSEASVHNYRPDWDRKDLPAATDEVLRAPRKGGRNRRRSARRRVQSFLEIQGEMDSCQHWHF